MSRKLPKIKPCPLCGREDDIMFIPAIAESEGRCRNPSITCLNCTLSLNGPVWAKYSPGGRCGDYCDDTSPEALALSDKTLIQRWNSISRRRKKHEDVGR